MSEIRAADIVLRFGNAAIHGKKSLRIELFSAEQFRNKWNPFKRTMYPHPPLRNQEFWQQYYRMRIDGRWIGRNKKGYKYGFYTLEEALQLAQKLFKGRNS